MELEVWEVEDTEQFYRIVKKGILQEIRTSSGNILSPESYMDRLFRRGASWAETPLLIALLPEWETEA